VIKRINDTPESSQAELIYFYFLAKKECHTSHDCVNNFPCLPLADNKEWSHELLTTYYKHYRRSYGVKKYCMGSTLSYAGLQRNDFDSTLGGQVFRGVEPPRTGGGKCHLFTKSYIYNIVL
jgi:hypothetical protein